MYEASSKSTLCCEYRDRYTFCNFSTAAREQLQSMGIQVAFPSGTILYQEGDRSESVAIVCDGQVKLSCSSRSGKSLILRIAGPGELLGLSSAVAGMPHETTAEIIAPAHLKVISRATFLHFLNEFPEAALHSTKVLALEYQKTFVDAKRLALSCSAEARLGKILLDWGRSVCTDPELRFQMPLSHAELGEMAGLSRETVTRTLSAFRRRKLLSIQGATIRILQPDVLEALCV